MELNLTHHAKVRMQQRCIPAQIIEWLKDYGAMVYDKRGCIRVFFTKASLERLARKAGRHAAKDIDKYRLAYLVMTVSGDVVTTGYRTGPGFREKAYVAGRRRKAA